MDSTSSSTCWATPAATPQDEAIAAIEKEGTLPDMLTFDPSKPAEYPNGRVFTDDVIDYRLAFLSKGDCPAVGPVTAHRHPDRVPLPRSAARALTGGLAAPDRCSRSGTVATMTATPREFDIVLYGATGFVGKLTAEYLARAGAGARIALAGRSTDRLRAVRDSSGGSRAVLADSERRRGVAVDAE